jgi:hypothetical protein
MMLFSHWKQAAESKANEEGEGEVSRREEKWEGAVSSRKVAVPLSVLREGWTEVLSDH